MISIEEARSILQDPQMTDKETEETVNSLQLLVELMFDQWNGEQKKLRVSGGGN
jgi:hypothetical protein